MTLATERVGRSYAARTVVADGPQGLAFAAATNDDNPRYRSGACLPPVFAVVPAWACLTEALADVLPAGAAAMIVHSEHDLRLTGRLVAGQRLTTRAEAFSLRPGRSGTRCTIRLVSEGPTIGGPVVEQYVTMFVRSMTGGDPAGPDVPDHGFPSSARDRLVGTHAVAVDLDQTQRYAAVSGDHNPIHLDDVAARQVGLAGRIVHGLCSMAMAGSSVIALVAGGDPARLRRLALRFSDVVSPGDVLMTSIYDMGPEAAESDLRSYAFESHCSGRLVLSHGRAEVGS